MVASFCAILVPTRSRSYLPHSRNATCCRVNCRAVSYAFSLGYDRGIDDYKVVRAVCCHSDHGLKETVIDLLALKVNVWKRIHENPRASFPVSHYT